MHRNTFLNSPQLLDRTYCLKKDRRIYFAGQITGVEGYIESSSSGILAGINLAMALKEKEPLILPQDTMMGALAAYISDPTVTDFQPMGSNMGLLPPNPERIKDKSLRYQAAAERALESFERCLADFRSRTGDALLRK